MALLEMLFPSILEKHNFSHLPNWNQPDRPWEILNSTNKDNISSQINNLIMNLQTVEKQKIIEINENVILDTSSGPIYVHPKSKISGFVKIEGPCYIGKGVEIRHGAFLREGSWLCEGSLVGHSTEVKNSILLPRSKAPHFNYVGDSILGFGVNIGAGVKLSNVRNDRRTIRVTLHNGEKIDTEMHKMGSIIGDKAEIGCNVVTNPGSIIPANSMIKPNSTVNGWFS